MEVNQNMMTQLGMMNKLTTGNMVLDVIVCLVLPVVMAHLTQYTDKIKEYLKRLLFFGGGYSREIGYATVDGNHWYDEDNSRNKVLQDAIFRYMDSNPKIYSTLKAAKFQLVKDKQLLQDLREPEEESEFRPRNQADFGSSYHSDSDCQDQSREILSYRVQAAPPENVKFEVEGGVSFQMTWRHENVDGKKSKCFRTLTLTSSATDGRVRIDGFVERALEYYKSVEAKKKDESRYFYTPLLSRSIADSSQEGHSSLMYKRYELSDEKTFDSFFHPEKEALLHMLDNFSNKKGKYAVPGYPHKLGLLLHGPPGTGKTSLIKALANHTKRHIISIPLSRVKTNQDLMDMVLDQACKVEGNDWTYKLPFRKTIFVMEDIDAAADVVHRRSEGSLELSERGKGKTKADAPNKFEHGEKGERYSDDHSVVILQGGSGMGKLTSLLTQDDELNLAGILNVLDGVIDCPNRLVVMTTNHPEKLDPALIRPGRINKKMYLGLLRVEEAKLMIERHYGTLEATRQEELNEYFPLEKISPAALECLCAECDAISEFFEGLHKLIAEIE